MNQLSDVTPSDDTTQPQNGGDGQGSGDSSDDGQGSSDNTMSDSDFEDIMDYLDGKTDAMGGGDDTPTGGNGMNIDNVPENMPGTETSEDNTSSKSSVQLSDMDKKIYLKRRLRNKRNS